MSHNINFNTQKGTHSFVSNKEKAWHGLGTIIDRPMTAEEAMRLANADFQVEKIQLDYPFGDQRNIAVGSFATVRMDNGVYLGTVRSTYEVVQNINAFGFFDAIIDKGEAIFETAGVLGRGERIFATAKLPEDLLVNGEHCNQYIVLTNSHDGTSSTTAGFTSIRVVCENTLQAALSGLKNKVSVPHRKGAKEKLEEAYKVMNIQSEYMSVVSEAFNKMSDYKMEGDALMNYITEVMKPINPTIKDAELSAQAKKQNEEIYALTTTHPTQLTPAAHGSLWGAYNGISLWANNRNYESQEAKFRSIMNGTGNTKIIRAFQLANELVS